MIRRALRTAVTGSLLHCCLTVAAQENGAWRAASTTARFITGDIALSNQKLAINMVAFAIARIRTLEKAEISAVFDADSDAAGNSSLYRLNVPAGKKFLHHNSLCGGEDTQWMVTYLSGRTLQVAFFSGEKAPLLTLEAIPNSTELCGTFTYVK